MSTVKLKSTITCPRCGHRKVETMPTDACQWFYECEGCATVLRPRDGDCCVFCSYGTNKCPPMQQQGSCCSPASASTAN
ncbi:GDCCVxC domain-containing (seleno)protein [Cupriavidus sp. TMH.W2]|uniref:GDCCVxC domain-containing (seleno)protein n=1 Tax=Cupriavidus sp. TMH.W2 TaxID=3434465 RepID=UPI003D77F794